MVFSSLVFLGLFLPILLILYFGALRFTKSLRVANKLLLASSLFFYAWGEPLWILALLFTSSVDYANGRRMGGAAGKPAKKRIMITSIVINLSILFAFKYLGFAITVINDLSGARLPVLSLSLPIGISFYTFQSLSYIVDLYRGRTVVQRSYFNYILYVSMFPQLVAGPIVRYADIEAQIQGRRATLHDFGTGIRRFCAGLGKKVVLANSMGAAALTLLDGNLSNMTTIAAWLGMLFFSFQIYFDFSGYSDMAIGLGRMFGFHYKENFQYPYVSRSVTEFWRRWHISLGSFFRDYVYIPLGGNRRAQVRNILIVWFLTGLWHGASWNFIGWGLYYGILLMIEKLLGGASLRLPGAFAWLVTMLIVLYGWGIFYFTDTGRLIRFSLVFFHVNADFGLSDLKAASAFFQYFWLLLVCFVASTPLPRDLFRRYVASRRALDLPWSVGVAALLALCFLLLVGESYNPFLYFRF